MPQKCHVCHHPSRDAIDEALVAGESRDALGKRYGIHPDALRRHYRNHVSAALAALHAQRGKRGGGTLLDRVEALIARAESILKAAESDGKVTTALAAVRELRSLLELLGKASGELKDTPAVSINLQASPEWLAIRAAVFSALMAYPEARAAVSGRLLELESGE